MIRLFQSAISCLFPIIGIVCVLLPRQVTSVLPYLLGGAMTLAGMFGVLTIIRGRKTSAQDSSALAHGIILLIMGAAFVLQGTNALGAMGTTWAILGIRRAARSLETVLRRIGREERFAAPLIEFFLCITLALVLLFDPFEKFSAHIVNLGLELIAVSTRIPTDTPPALEDGGRS